MTLAGRLAASVADPIPEISKTRLAADLFGPRRWGECIVAADGAGIAGYATLAGTLKRTPVAGNSASATCSSTNARAAPASGVSFSQSS
jgi:hypothetical protein